MPDPLKNQKDIFVVLEPDLPEQYLTAHELLEKLKSTLAHRQQELPRDLQKFTSSASQAQYLLETYCELDLGPGEFLQWYAVRLEK